MENPLELERASQQRRSEAPRRSVAWSSLSLALSFSLRCRFDRIVEKDVRRDVFWDGWMDEWMDGWM
jgi:hypothetical protein